MTYTMTALSMRRSFERLEAMIDRVRVQHPIFNRVDVELGVTDVATVRMLCWMRVPDRNAPEREDGSDAPEIPIRAEYVIDGYQLLKGTDDEGVLALAEWVRGSLCSMMNHEIAEMILVDGERRFDPHRDDPVSQDLAPGLLEVLADPGVQQRMAETYRRDRIERRRRRGR